jgi:hypothetical protein
MATWKYSLLRPWTVRDRFLTWLPRPAASRKLRALEKRRSWVPSFWRPK